MFGAGNKITITLILFAELRRAGDKVTITFIGCWEPGTKQPLQVVAFFEPGKKKNNISSIIFESGTKKPLQFVTFLSRGQKMVRANGF